MELGYSSLPGRRLRTSAQRSSPTSVQSLGKGNDDSTYTDSSHQFLAGAQYPQTNYAARISSYSYHDPGPAPWMSGGLARPLRQFSPPSEVREPPTGDSTVLNTLVYRAPFAIPTDEQRAPSPALNTPIPGPPREFQSYPIASASPFPSDYHLGQSHDTRDGFHSVEGNNSPDFLSVPAQSTTQLHRFDPLHFVSNAGSSDDKLDQTSPCNPSSETRTDNLSSILMCNNSGSSSSPSRQFLATSDPPLDGRSRSITDSKLQPNRDVIVKSLYNSKAGPCTQLAKKKKKSKMHACELCGKSFPRPSGLRTHMNTHNNVKPYPCGFPGCRRSFAVRSNAKRHLRTHGVLPPSSLDDPAPYVVGFNTPTVMPPLSTQSSSKVPFRLRWMPPSLVNRSNAGSLKSLSDPEYSDDEGEPDEGSALSIPLRAAIPSSRVDDGDEEYEERNSYIDVGSHPYHPSQFGFLPGPAVVSPWAC